MKTKIRLIGLVLVSILSIQGAISQAIAHDNGSKSFQAIVEQEVCNKKTNDISEERAGCHFYIKLRKHRGKEQTKADCMMIAMRDWEQADQADVKKGCQLAYDQDQ